MTARPSRGAPLFIVVVLLSMPLLYLGSYASLADTDAPLRMCDDGICRPRRYHYGGKVAEAVFWPVRQIDQQMRGFDD